jgi:TonB-linked SusC/RagA family outer membrane protein
MKTKFNGILTLLLALVVQFTFAQSKTISGTISDESGPLPGVSIIVKGTGTGTETDFDGNYSLSANTGDVLQYSFIGMSSQSRTVGASNNINVVMEADAEALNEVVISGFGRKVEARSSTFSSQQLEGDEFTKAREANLSNALSGKIAGVQVTSSSGAVGASARVVLRGASSITGSNEPLYVVDGVPIYNGTGGGNAGSGGGRDLPNGVSDINPDDIESMNVLKGPAAAALYGVRAANGVIEIKTKTGKKNSTLGINFSTNVDFQNALILPEYQNSYGQGGSTDNFEFIDGTSGDGGIDESWGPPLDVGLEFVQWDSYKVGGAPLPWVSHPNNIKDFYDTGVTLTNNLSLSGGAENISYRLSLGNMDQTGIIPFTDYSKFNVGGSSSLTIGEKLTTTVSINYIKSASDNLPIAGYNNENPIQQFIWSGRNVDFQALKDWRNLPLSADGTAAAGTPLNWNTVFQNNPYWVLETNTNDLDKDRVIGNVGFNYQFNDNFSLNGKLGIDHWNSLTTSRQEQGSNNATFGSYREDVRSYTERNADVFLSYNTEINEDFTFDISVGGAQMKRNRQTNIVTAGQLQLPGLFDLNNLRAGSNYTITDYTAEQRINSFIGYGKIGYKNLVFLEFSGRNDWASILPVDNNSFFYPSVTGSAVISDIIGSDDFFLKVRGGWSKVGGIGALNPYELAPVYGLSSEPFGSTTVAFLPGTLNNPNIKSESTQGYEVGADVRLFDSKLRFTATYYDQTSTDLVVPVQVSPSSGYTNAISNVGELNNKGIELQLNSTVLRNDDWKLDVGVNFAKNENTVVSLGGLEALVLGGQWNMTLEAREGQPYGSIVGNYWERTPNGSILYENGQAKLASGTKILGNVTPDWAGGMNFTLDYKNFSFYTLIDAKIGGDIHSMTTTWGNYAGALSNTVAGRETGIIGDGQMLATDGTYVPNNVVVTAESFNKNFYSNSIVESAVFDASYVKLRQMMLTYKLPKDLLNNTGINDVSFSVVGRNLAILHKNAPHIDPESAFSSSNGEQGQEFGQIPSTRTIGFNVRVGL